MIVALMSMLVLGGQTYPPPFPRSGAKALVDNARVQVWDVSWPKGEPTPLHRHPYAMTGVYYAPGDRVITAVDGSKRPVTTTAGGIVWQLKGLTHIEEGTSGDPLRAVMIELKGDGPSGKIEKTPGVAAFTGSTMPLLDNERVTVWDYVTGSDAGQSSRRGLTPAARHSHPMDTVVVWTEGRVGHAAFVPAGTVHADEPSGTATKATIFELK